MEEREEKKGARVKKEDPQHGAEKYLQVAGIAVKFSALHGKKHCRSHQKRDFPLSKVAKKGTKSELTGPKREPTEVNKDLEVSQGATKMHQKVDLRKRSRKESQKEGCAALSLDPIWEHVPSKIDGKF